MGTRIFDIGGIFYFRCSMVQKYKQRVSWQGKNTRERVSELQNEKEERSHRYKKQKGMDISKEDNKK